MIKPSDYLKRTQTDKLYIHDYGWFYDFVFTALLNIRSPVRILEIGISMFGNGSGHAFAAMPNVEFTAIDIREPSIPLPSGTFIKENAYSQEALRKLKPHAPFDLVIDDGSHFFRDQIFFFENYIAFCSQFCVMICEDVHERDIADNVYSPLNHLNLSLIRPTFFGGRYDSNLLVSFPESRLKPQLEYSSASHKTTPF